MWIVSNVKFFRSAASSRGPAAGARGQRRDASVHFAGSSS